jgi:hypothetical protein
VPEPRPFPPGSGLFCSNCGAQPEYCFCLDEDGFGPQSGLERFSVSITEPPSTDKEAVTTFKSQNPAYSYAIDSDPDSTFNIADTPNSGVETFFSRPIVIDTLTWGIGQKPFKTINPWKAFFENPRVLNRVANYAMLRARLHVRVLINGTGFHYGRMLLDYIPMPDFDEVSSFLTDRSLDLIEASQRPHLYLDPCNSVGGDMVLPFVYDKNAVSVVEQEWSKLGILTLRCLQGLKHANDAADPVTITVMAWAEEVSLSMPTVYNPSGLGPQSGKEQDEYGSGPISKPASMVARASGVLSNAPIIGPYARATSIAAGSLANIAALFGYSRPAVISDIESYKPTLVGNMANTNMPDSCQRLTLDSKQEVTIDSRVVGLTSSDEMCLKDLAMRESFLTKFDWTLGDGPDTFLWNTKVTPMMYDVLEGSTDATTEYHCTPACWVSLPFRYWKGSMKIRFQIVASNYHKGRIVVTYDPLGGATSEYNTAYNHIIDISETKDFTVTIGWGQPWGYAAVTGLSKTSSQFGTTRINYDPFASHNGVVSVRVMNKLNTPNTVANNDVQVNVFVSMCDDFEVANPTSRNLKDLSWKFPQHNQFAPTQLTPQSGIEQEDADNTPNPDAPVSMMSDPLTETKLDPEDPSTLVYFGEQITSWRQCLKRYCYHSTFGTLTGGHNYYFRVAPDFPFYRGFLSSGVHQTSTGDAYNFCAVTLLNYVSPAYVCRRGGLRWKYVRASCLSSNSNDHRQATALMTVRRIGKPEIGQQYEEYEAAIEDKTSADVIAANAAEWQNNTWDGVTASISPVNPVVEAELPYQSRERFRPARRANLTSPLLEKDDLHEFMSIHDTPTGGGTIYNTYCATGEDFSLSFFLSTPILTKSALPSPKVPVV